MLVSLRKALIIWKFVYEMGNMHKNNVDDIVLFGGLPRIHKLHRLLVETRICTKICSYFISIHPYPLYDFL
ncbi:hypothetical protein L1987_52703 [Smallanthus sonchifolius]|uniref:Uncharacterized protein n=1 Tax=Smallanthus sonchifolius TaxID=185202 RepID=A0ACB9ET79_9ASTR|nr:hypothetical protein L1987_52703 [Smallanthus sonchifolius]